MERTRDFFTARASPAYIGMKSNADIPLKRINQAM